MEQHRVQWYSRPQDEREEVTIAAPQDIGPVATTLQGEGNGEKVQLLGLLLMMLKWLLCSHLGYIPCGPSVTSL